MATSDSHPEFGVYVPDVTLAVARPAGGGGSGGGAGSLAYSTPNGLADGEEITVTTDGSEGWDFGPAPKELATLGFGQGLLYTASTGANFQDHVDAFSGAAWDWEFTDFSSSRLISETPEGVRVLESPNGSSGGFVTYVADDLLPENEKVFISRLSKGQTDFINPGGNWLEIQSVTATEITLTEAWSGYDGPAGGDVPLVTATDPNNESSGSYRLRGNPTSGSTAIEVTSGDPVAGGVQVGDFIGLEVASQWKGLRLSNTGEYGDPANEDAYFTPRNGRDRVYNPAKGTLVASSRIEGADGSGACDQFNDEWVRVDYLLDLGTFDTSDGNITSNSFCPGEDVVATYDEPYSNSPNQTLVHGVSGDSIRIGGFSWQEYSKGATNANKQVTDFIIQIGTKARVELADSDDPDTTKESYVLPPVVGEWTSTTAKFRLWKAFASGYSGRYLQFFDENGTFRKAVAL